MIAQQKILRVFKLIQFLKSKPRLSVGELAKKIESSERTVFRYFELLTELGFDIELDFNSKYFIVGDFEEEGMNFTDEELKLLNTSLNAIDKSSPFHQQLSQKLKTHSDVHFFGKELVQANHAKKIEQCRIAIELNCRLELENYYSLNSQTSSTRVVEPLGFDDDYESIRAIDIRQPDLIKTFKINRCENIKALQKNEQQYTSGKVLKQKDPFNFSGDKSIRIKLIISTNTKTLLTEQYKKTKPFLVKRSKDSFDFQVEVFNIEAIKRFILANLDGVKIIEPKALKEELKTFYEKHINAL
ncbi:MAG: helix-turn-helix transcriptional regulator [Flavobacteriales bacterium]